MQSNPTEDAAKLIAAVIIERLAATKAARASFATNKISQSTSENNSTTEDDLERL